MTSSREHSPRVDVEISFDQQSYSFSQAFPPTFTLKITSKASTPITLFTWNTPLSLPSAFTSNGVTITDTTMNEPVQTALIMVQRVPLKRTKGTSDEKYFVTLFPNTVVDLSTGIGRAGGGVKPQPNSIVERGLELNENGTPMNIRRSKFATGVDGLEPGHKYSIGLNKDALKRIWWAPVDRDEILVNGTAEGSYVQDYEWVKTPLQWSVSEATLAVEE